MSTDQQPDSASVVIEPIAVQVTRFVCPYCRRGRSRKAPAAEHMKKCWKNPDLRGCKTCVFFQPATYSPTRAVPLKVIMTSGGRRPELAPARCGAGYSIGKGLVTNCKKWKAPAE